MLVGRGGRESDEEGPCCKTFPTAPAGTDEFESPKLGGGPALGLCFISTLLF